MPRHLPILQRNDSPVSNLMHSAQQSFVYNASQALAPSARLSFLFLWNAYENAHNITKVKQLTFSAAHGKLSMLLEMMWKVFLRHTTEKKFQDRKSAKKCQLGRLS